MAAIYQKWMEKLYIGLHIITSQGRALREDDVDIH